MNSANNMKPGDLLLTSNSPVLVLNSIIESQTGEVSIHIDLLRIQQTYENLEIANSFNFLHMCAHMCRCQSIVAQTSKFCSHN